jgi:hypothetical protein
MEITENILTKIVQPEIDTLEYKAILPPSRNIAQIIASFANTNGGDIVLGILDNLEIKGLEEDVHAMTVTYKALDLLTPRPIARHQYLNYQGKKIYVISVEKSNNIISLEGKVFIRTGPKSILANQTDIPFSTRGVTEIRNLNTILTTQNQQATNSKQKYIEHYQSVLKIMDDLGNILYPPNTPNQPTENKEGKILNRILFSSCVDNFETYLSDLLYEIYLAKPDTLKSEKQVSIKSVLNCADLDEFVKFWANELLGKLQKGSVKGFLKDTKQISELNVLDEPTINDIENILQIRHLYSHKNGIVDEKFLQFYPQTFTIGSEYLMSIIETCNKFEYLANVVDKIDKAAILKYNLSTN